ncbi:branched-chain amino acid ABC transporter permease [Bradyrhizobium sp. 1]|uniref:branched-chain amino acid ABC transporter permease n=1 Tax=Bradyrhizobium sp. 1 TaxID=241591 RepID=UPI001FFBB01F|nr:branched-chain amino acid ABC transporter permease [Bradyrhizobium sp. 1]MCK1394439.1 branched-chain amino acid ABC transporter permease [Bradyrhizobium sp. 1]
MLQRLDSYHCNLIGLGILIVLEIAIGSLVQNSYYLTVINLCMIFGIASVGLTVLMGYAGLISLGQSAFFGIGAYVSANLATNLNVEPVLALMIGAMAAGVIGWLIARPLLRLSDLYFAMASLAFGIIAYILFGQMRGITGGLDPGFSSAPFSVLGWRLGDTRSMYWVCATSLAIVALFVLNLVHSRFGRALKALGSSEIAADGLGISVVAYKAMALAISAGITGVAGGLFAFFLRSFNSSAFGFNLSIELLVMVIVGSVRSVWGALLGATLVTVLPSLLDRFEDYKLFAYGVAMVIIVMIMPEGLFQAMIEASQKLISRRKPT